MTSLTRSAARLLDVALDRSVVGGYSVIGLALRRRLPGWPTDPDPGVMRGRTAMVTGASSGLGMQTCRDLAHLGAEVHLVVRNEEKGARVRDRLRTEVPGATFQLWRCDVADLADVRRFTGEYAATTRRLDVLVHNAGVMPPQRTESPQGHELSMATHVLGPLLLTEELRPRLAAADGRVVFVTSGGMYAQRLPGEDPDYQQGEYRGATAYARSKRVQVALLPVLAERWRPDGTTVYAMHPGWADTPGVADSLPGFHRLTRPILRDDAQGADTTIWLAATEPAPPSGTLWQDRGRRPAHAVPWTRESDAARAAMWRWCARAAGVVLDEEPGHP